MSDDADNRVSIEDLPQTCDVESGKYYRNKRWEAYLSMNTNAGSGDMKTLKVSTCTYDPFHEKTNIMDTA